MRTRMTMTTERPGCLATQRDRHDTTTRMEACEMGEGGRP
jgi:hypothetical protein